MLQGHPYIRYRQTSQNPRRRQTRLQKERFLKLMNHHHRRHWGKQMMQKRMCFLDYLDCLMKMFARFRRRLL
jgi:hypothetical protein